MDALDLPQLRKWKKNVVCMCAETAKMLTSVDLHACFDAWLLVCIDECCKPICACTNVCTGRLYLLHKYGDIYMHGLCKFDRYIVVL